MTVKEMYDELRALGFSEALISKQTGISVSKFKHMRFGKYARFTYPEVCAFDAYYQTGKTMAKVYGYRLAEILAEKEK